MWQQNSLQLQTQHVYDEATFNYQLAFLYLKSSYHIIQLNNTFLSNNRNSIWHGVGDRFLSL